MRIAAAIGVLILIVGVIVYFVARRKPLAHGGVMSYGDLRQRLIQDAQSSPPPERHALPSRPQGLDTRLPASVGEEFRASFPETPDTGRALMDIVFRGQESVRNELLALDQDVDWYELLSPERRAVLICLDCEGEVSNGGFDQYFLNSAGDGARFAPDAFRLIGENTVAALIERANAVFPGGPSQFRPERLRQMGRLTDSDRARWNSLNKEFYSPACGGGGAALTSMPKFIHDHMSEFFKPQ